MKKNLKNTFADIEDFFSSPPSSNQKAWGIINDFYHMVLTYMEKNNISQADLAKKIGVSRSAISQMFNKTPNISVKKMVEISDAIGINLKITSSEVPLEISNMNESRQNHVFIFVNTSKHEKFKISSSENKNDYKSHLNTSLSIPASHEYRETLYN